jgi:hypothetical protein
MRHACCRRAVILSALNGVHGDQFRYQTAYSGPSTMSLNIRGGASVDTVIGAGLAGVRQDRGDACA